MEQRIGAPFYRKFFRIFIVLVLQNIVTLSVNLADNMMLGAYNEAALSGVAAVNQIQFVYQQLLMAFGDGLVIICSQYWGRRQTEPMKKIASIAMWAGLGLAVLLFALVSFFPHQAVGIFTTDGPIIAQGVEYLAIIRFTYLFFAVTQILLATLVARILETAVVVLYVLRHNEQLRLKLRDYFHFDKVLGRDYFKTTLPLLIGSGLWGLNTAMQTVILGHMTAAAIAANSVASNIFLMVKSMAVGASATATIIIGNAIGEGNIDLVKRYAKVMQKLFLGIGVFSGILLYLIRVPILSFYELSPETMEMANNFLLILSVVVVGMSYQMPTNGGIIRGGGDTAFVVKMDLISIWGIVIPLSLIMAFVVQAPPIVVVWCLNADQLFKCIPAYIKCNHGHWIKKLTRD